MRVPSGVPVAAALLLAVCAPRSAGAQGAQPYARSNPYGNLFRGELKSAPKAPAFVAPYQVAPSPVAPSQVVPSQVAPICMPVMPGDPSIDPAISHAPPKGETP